MVGVDIFAFEEVVSVDMFSKAVVVCVVVGVDISASKVVVSVDMFGKAVVVRIVVGVDISVRNVVVSVDMFGKVVGVGVVKEVVIPIVVVSVGVSGVKEVCGFTVVSCFGFCEVEDVLILEVVSVDSTVSKNVDFVDIFDDSCLVCVVKRVLPVAIVVVGVSVVKIAVALTVVVDFGGSVVKGFTVLFKALVVDCCVAEVVVSVGMLFVKSDVVPGVVSGACVTVVEVRVVVVADGIDKGVEVVFAEEEANSIGVETEVGMGVGDTDNIVSDA